MSPLSYYHEQVQKGLLVKDQQQCLALAALEKTYEALCREDRKRSGFFSFLRKPQLVQGNYLYGGVGIGKTFLMDCFYNCLPFPQKMRMHFHQFMHLIHQELKKHQGSEDPLCFIAEELAKKNRLLCFDELVVSDITDAMILGRLFQLLYSKGLTLVFTSNLQPDDLYKNGLQRQHFLPVIALLKKHSQLNHLTTVEDYRLRHLKQAGVFHMPNNEAAEAKMEKSFSILAGQQAISQEPVEICERRIPIKKQAGDIIWFDFNTLCSVPRSHQDYLVIAEQYSTVFLSDLSVIPGEARAKVSLLIRLIDVLYDAKVRLVLSSEVAVSEIYTNGQLLFDYARACSRLLEMQSESYFLGSFKTD